MMSLRSTTAIILLFLTLSLAACQANPVESSPSPSPSPNFAATSTPILPTQTTAIQTASVVPSPTAMQRTGKEFSSLESELIAGVDWYIVIQDANSGEILFERNPHSAFHPASMIKIPTAMAVLSILEDQDCTLEDLKTTGINGTNFDRLLEDMVVRSEESAADALEYFARGDNQLRKKLDAWGLTNTKYDPRTSTAHELLTSLRLLYEGKVLNEGKTQFLLTLMGEYTENDQILLGKLTGQFSECVFLNKRGTMLNPTIVSDMGILKCSEQSWYLVVAGTPSVGSTATFEDIQASIEDFAVAFASLVK